MNNTFKIKNFMEHLSADVAQYLRSRSQVRDYDRGAVLSLEGELTKTMKVVQSGWVKHYRVITCRQRGHLVHFACRPKL